MRSFPLFLPEEDDRAHSIPYLETARIKAEGAGYGVAR